jgi:hypothetical protein
MKNTKSIHSKAFQNIANLDLDFLFANIPSGNPGVLHNCQIYNLVHLGKTSKAIERLVAAF